MARYSQETKAQAVAEYWLTGSQRRVAEQFDLGSHHTIGEWVRAVEAPKTAQDQRVRARAQAIHEQRKAGLDEAYQRALDLQMRDLPDAEFSDRTLFLKVIGQHTRLRDGKPTGILDHRSTDPLDVELEQLISEEAARRASRS